MKAALALILIYVGTFLVAIQGSSNSSVEASEQQAGQQTAAQLDPVKEKEIRSLLELVGARDAIEDAATASTEQYRQKMIDNNPNSDRAQAVVNTYLTEFHKKLDTEAVTTQLVGVYDKHFTEDEIKGLLEFYGSPLGQKFSTEMPKASREMQMIVRQASGQAARETWQDLRAEYQQNAGENAHGRNARRRNPVANPPGQQASGTQQAAVDSQQP